MNLNLLKDPRTNWKFIFIVVILGFLTSAGILGYYYWWIKDLETRLAEIELKLPEKIKEEGFVNPIEEITNQEFAKYFELLLEVNPGLKFSNGKRTPRLFHANATDFPPPPQNQEDPLWIFSPDGTKAVSVFAQFGNPDSSLDIYNRNNDGKVENLGFCGTVCYWGPALWLDNGRFITFNFWGNGHFKLYILLYDLIESSEIIYASQELKDWPKEPKWPREWQERLLKVCKDFGFDEIFCEEQYGL